MKQENTKERIEEAALLLFHKISYSKTSVEDISKAAKIGKGTIYLYFKSKEDIVSSIINKRFLILKEVNKDVLFNENIEINKKIDCFFEKLIDEYLYLKDLLFGNLFENFNGKLIREVFIKYSNKHELSTELLTEVIEQSKIESKENLNALKNNITEFIKLITGRIILYFLEQSWDDTVQLKNIITKDVNVLLSFYFAHSLK